MLEKNFKVLQPNHHLILLSPPLNHTTKDHITPTLKCLQGWGPHLLPGQPIPMPSQYKFFLISNLVTLPTSGCPLGSPSPTQPLWWAPRSEPKPLCCVNYNEQVGNGETKLLQYSPRGGNTKAWQSRCCATVMTCCMYPPRSIWGKTNTLANL